MVQQLWRCSLEDACTLWILVCFNFLLVATLHHWENHAEEICSNMLKLILRAKLSFFRQQQIPKHSCSTNNMKFVVDCRRSLFVMIHDEIQFCFQSAYSKNFNQIQSSQSYNLLYLDLCFSSKLPRLTNRYGCGAGGSWTVCSDFSSNFSVHFSSSLLLENCVWCCLYPNHKSSMVRKRRARKPWNTPRRSYRASAAPVAPVKHIEPL